jgi:hypothetical protein
MSCGASVYSRPRDAGADAVPSRMPLSRSDRVVLAILLVGGIVHGLVYVVAIPPWDLFDEQAHYGYAASIRDERRIPRIDDLLPDEIVESTAASDRWASFRLRRPPSLDARGLGLEGRLYESYHGPAYYAAVALWTLPTGHRAHRGLYAGRLLGPLLLAALGALAWGLAREWFPRAGSVVWGAAGVMAIAPPAAAEAAGRVNNDLLVAVLTGAAVLVAWRLLSDPGRGRALLLGGLGAAAVLTKGQGALVLALAAVVVVVLRRRRALDVSTAVACLAPGLVAVAAWALVSHQRYGEWSPVEAFLGFVVPFQRLSTGTFAEGLVLNSWSSYWVAYDGGTLRIVTGTVVAAIAVLGLVPLLRVGELRLALLLTGVLGTGLVIGLWLGNARGLVHPQGRVLLPVLPPVAALVAGGWHRWLGRAGAAAAPLAAAAMSAVFFVTWFQPFFHPGAR